MMRLRLARSASRIRRSAFETFKEDASLRDGDWMIAGHEVARVSMGGVMLEASGKKALGVSGVSLRVSSDSYSKTSGMHLSVGEKVEARGVPGFCDMSGMGDGRGSDCLALWGGEGREGSLVDTFTLGESGIGAGVEGQNGAETLEMKVVCCPEAVARRDSHRGGEKSSMSNTCDRGWI